MINVIQGDVKQLQALIRDKILDNLSPAAGLADAVTRTR